MLHLIPLTLGGNIIERPAFSGFAGAATMLAITGSFGGPDGGYGRRLEILRASRFEPAVVREAMSNAFAACTANHVTAF